MITISKVFKILVVYFHLLAITSCHSAEQVKQQIPEDWFYNSGIDSAREFRLFFDELRKDIKSGNKQGVARKINYPITINLNGKDSSVKSEVEFIESYDLIINDKVEKAIESQSFDKIKRYPTGVRIGLGVLWISKVKTEGQKEASIKVFKINN